MTFNLPLHPSDYALEQKWLLANKVAFIFSVSSCREQCAMCVFCPYLFFIPSLQMGFFYSILPGISTCIACKTFSFLTEPFGPLTFIDTVFIDSQIHSLSDHIILTVLFLQCNSNPVRLRPANTALSCNTECIAQNWLSVFTMKR